MIELKPCPFCGREVSILRFDNYWLITRGTNLATSCECRVFMESDAFHKDDVVARRKAKEDLIKKWNARPNPWHTGLPTEEGMYLCYQHQDGYFVEHWDGNSWFEYDQAVDAWQKIELYVEG